MKRSIDRWLYTSALVALALLFAVPATASRKTKPVPRPLRRFDHEAHAKVLAAKGKKLGCEGQCHVVDAAGKFLKLRKAEHHRCDSCHKIFTHCNARTRKGGRACLTCHQNLKCFLGEKPNFATLKNTFVATYSHKQHIQPGASTGRQCEGCHGKFGDAPPRRQGALSGGHQFCSGCHERGVEPLMNDCAKCHVDRDSPQGKVPVAMPRQATPYATTGAFSHSRHAGEQRVGTKGRECLTCHANIADSKDTKVIPLPTMQGCYKSCHNGRQAFSAIGATCTRCHRKGGS